MFAVSLLHLVLCSTARFRKVSDALSKQPQLLERLSFGYSSFSQIPAFPIALWGSSRCGGPHTFRRSWGFLTGAAREGESKE